MALVIALGMGAAAPVAAPAGEPTEQLRTQLERVLKTVQDPELKKAGRVAQRRAVRKVADEVFDYGDTARRALSRHWAQRSASERQEFVALFADQSKLDEASLVKTAQSLGLDEKSFQSCLTGGKFNAQIEQDVQDGTKAGVNSTPGFFINGEFVSGAQPEAEFEKIIERELAISGIRTTVRASR